MATANVPKVGHIYDPISDETITNSDGLVELIITDRTTWEALCDSNISISNDEYKALFSDFELVEDCDDCTVKAIQEDPLGVIYDL